MRCCISALFTQHSLTISLFSLSTQFHLLSFYCIFACADEPGLQVAKLFGGLDIVSMDVLHGTDGKDYVLEINDTAPVRLCLRLNLFFRTSSALK
jgi:hypothetical protein